MSKNSKSNPVTYSHGMRWDFYLKDEQVQWSIELVRLFFCFTCLDREAKEYLYGKCVTIYACRSEGKNAN